MGPKEAHLEPVQWSVAPSSYVRHARCGVFSGLLGTFCEKAYVKEIPSKCRGLGLGYRIVWV